MLNKNTRIHSKAPRSAIYKSLENVIIFTNTTQPFQMIWLKFGFLPCLMFTFGREKNLEFDYFLRKSVWTKKREREPNNHSGWKCVKWKENEKSETNKKGGEWCDRQQCPLMYDDNCNPKRKQIIQTTLPTNNSIQCCFGSCFFLQTIIIISKTYAQASVRFKFIDFDCIRSASSIRTFSQLIKLRVCKSCISLDLNIKQAL